MSVRRLAPRASLLLVCVANWIINGTAHYLYFPTQPCRGWRPRLSFRCSTNHRLPPEGAVAERLRESACRMMFCNIPKLRRLLPSCYACHLPLGGRLRLDLYNDAACRGRHALQRDVEGAIPYGVKGTPRIVVGNALRGVP